MAKKKATPKKKSPAKKNNSNSKGKPAVVIIILLVVFGIIFYGVNETGKFTGNTVTKKEPVKEEKASAGSNKIKNEASAKAKDSKKINSSDITSLDGQKEESSLNENLPDYSNSGKYYYTRSFDFAWPAYTQDDAIVEHQFYTLAYNEKTEQANWIAYSLSAANLKNAQFKRKDNFKSDPGVSTESASPTDYAKSGYDRGHLAPAADFTWTKEGLDESFYMSNMSPQVPGFNRGIWKNLEGQVRTWAMENHKLYIVTGPVVQKRADKIGKNKVSVPQYYYKAILDIQEPGLKAIGFLMKNEKSSKDIMSFAMSIDELEEFTGLDFFPSVPDELEGKLESAMDKGLWRP
ncbi:MAG: endonuclease G [Cyclobacteriaceae bacterium]|jgi:endonuclease G